MAIHISPDGRKISLLAAARAAVLAGTALSASLGGAAFAQSTDTAGSGVQRSGRLAEVVVTAERRRTTAQKTAASVSVRNGEDLRKNGQYSLAQILEDVPGVTGGAATGIGGSDAAGSGVTIRGIASNGSTAGAIVSGVPTTAIYTDDVYEGIGSSYDINRVEILRGPQGTLYGRSATAGVIATHTRDPILGKFGGDESVEIGNYGLLHYDGAINLPLVSDILALRVSGNHYQRDGYISRSGGKRSNDDWRAKLLYQPSPDFSAMFAASAEYNVTHTGGTNTDLSGPNTLRYTTGLAIAPGHDHFNQYWANINWNLGPATLTYIPAVRSWHQNSAIYTNGTLIVRQTALTPYDQFLTQELRLASNGSAALTWVTGLFGYVNKVKDYTAIRWVPSTALIQSALAARLTEDAGVFGEASYKISPKLTVTGGLRYDYTYVNTREVFTSNKNNGITGFPGTTSFSLPEDNITKSITGKEGANQWRNVTFKARAEYNLTNVNKVYAMVTSGFLPGDVQIAASTVNGQANTPVPFTYAEETLRAYELGSKNRFLDDKLQVNGDVYYNDYSGYQTALNASNSATAISEVIVSIPARVMGSELEVLYRATPNDTFGLNAAYVWGNYNHIPSVYSRYVSEKNFTGIVPLTIDPSYAHVFNLADGSAINAHADAEFTNAYHESVTSPTVEAMGYSPYAHIGDQIIGNVSANWTSANGRYSVDVFVRNLANNRYKLQGAYTISSFGVATTGTPHDPRTLGVSEHISF